MFGKICENFQHVVVTLEVHDLQDTRWDWELGIQTP